MTASTAEMVLCSRTADLPAAWLPEAGCIPLSEDQLKATLAPIRPVWLPRSQAETDASYKQWISYTLLADPHGRWAAYPRQGSETRLHGNWSLGIGGHVNPVDQPAVVVPGDSLWSRLLWNGFQRELAEEYPSAVQGQSRFLGLIHEHLTPVGRVHLGAVFLHRTALPPAPPSAELSGLVWLDPALLDTPAWPLDRFELWSRLALDLVRSSPL